MIIIYNDQDLVQYMENAVHASPDHPVLIDRFLENAYEFDVDAIADGSRCVIGGFMQHIEKAGIHRTQVIPLIGKLFLDFGLHAPTVAFPEVYGLMIEPTESFSKAELDHFIEVVAAIHHLINETPEILKTVPHFTPVDKIDEVGANRNPQLSERLGPALPEVIPNRIDSGILRQSSVEEVRNKILEAHRQEARHHE